ncbi:hypothetical protein EVAR_88557_1 [Eumeta japonica]|uniref:Uncharacterized protein n=1 Tax=Eumeta variegata TaxID=151549 RepID=A0A4C1WMX6_EUMVA|nr:hypothetical protein EVAR_88557_1 [Eumeta japonica]
MRQAQQMAEECSEDYMEVTYDLAIAKVALQLQSTEKPKYNNLFIHLGSFHIMMAYFKAVGKFIDNCGLTNIMENAEILSGDVPSSFGNISKKLMQVFTANSADTVIIAFDRYIFPSIKDNEHSLRRRVKGQRFQINGPDQIRPSNFADALKNIYFKETLVDFIIDDWANDYMAPFIGSKTILVNYLQCHQYKVCQGKVQRTSESSLACPGHEEADTKIVFRLSLDF